METEEQDRFNQQLIELFSAECRPAEWARCLDPYVVRYTHEVCDITVAWDPAGHVEVFSGDDPVRVGKSTIAYLGARLDKLERARRAAILHAASQRMQEYLVAETP